MENTGKLSDKEIADLKAKHGEIFALEFEDGKVAYFKKPDRKVLSLAMTKMQTSPLNFAETIITNCFIGGAEEVKTDDAYFMGASSQLDGLMQAKSAELKKL